MLGPGLYAVEFAVVTLAVVPVLADVEARSEQLMLVRLEEAPDGWKAYQTTCDIRVDGGGIAVAEIPDAFVRATGSKWTQVTMDERSYTADLGVHNPGWKLAVESEAMPDDIEDPRVFDWDGDGEPAATIWVHAPVFGKITLNVVQKSRTILHGTQTADGSVEGWVELLYLQQRTLGASNFLFRGNIALEPQPDRSSFKMWDVPEDMTCEKLKRATWAEATP